MVGANTGKNSAGDVRGEFQVRVSYGEILENGQAIELVASPSGDRLQLLYWGGKKFEIGFQVRCGDITYVAPFLDLSLLQAVRFPSGAAEYGSAEELFTNIASLLQQWMGLDEAPAAGVALWIRSSWLPELYSSPPVLCITGSERLAVLLFRLLRALCRHPLLLAELNSRLPFILGLTLLVNDPGLSAKRQAAWRTSNCRGFFVPGKGGKLQNLASSKAVYSGNEDSTDAWGPGTLHLHLLPSMEPTPELSESEEQQLAALFQPQLLRYRLCNLPVIQQPDSPTRPRAASSTFARDLLGGMQDVPSVAKAAKPLVVAHEDELAELRSLDPVAVIVECVWAPAHESREIAAAELLKRVNALLRNRGEGVELNEKELGWKLRQLQIPRRRNGKGMVVRFSSEVRRRVHSLARQFGLRLPPKTDCSFCQAAQTDEPQRKM
jgi:hypothetical protein